MTFSLFREADGPLLGSVSLCRSNVKVFVDRDKEGREEGRQEGGCVPFLAAVQRDCQRSTGEPIETRIDKTSGECDHREIASSAEMSTAFLTPMHLLSKSRMISQ